MGTSVSMSKRRNYVIFLNLSFVFASCVFFLISRFHSEKPPRLIRNSNNIQTFETAEKQGCNGLGGLEDHEAKCSYLKSKSPCVSQGYIDYLYLFYCSFGGFPFLGYSLLVLWLLVLFYLLGNTASEYFCSSLESLSKLLKLSPAIAGVTLLSLGNGAPDVFASLVSFMGGGTSEIGFNTVLGGASVVSCVVVGLIAISLRNKGVKVNKSDFVRDVFFLLLVLLCLGVILVQKEIDLWGAMIFFSIYIVYVVVVYVLHTRLKNACVHENDLTVPILPSLEKGENNNNTRIVIEEIGLVALVQQDQEETKWSFICCWLFLSMLEMPLYLPRRLTIPVICEEKWSKLYAVVSVTLAPLLLVSLGNHQMENPGTLGLVFYVAGSVFGVIFGVLAYLTTEISSPPKKYIFPWLVAGFLMSVTWSYITAQELVGLLVSLAYVLGVDPSILGLTVLAWGNSIGDLVTNLTMAMNGGPEGAQVAFSGCYAGPIFNTLFGLGLSLIGYCWSKYPSAVVLPADPYLFQTLGFLAAGLFWALLVLPSRDMRLDGVFGVGLLVIYIVSISLSLFQAVGSAQGLHVDVL